MLTTCDREAVTGVILSHGIVALLPNLQVLSSVSVSRSRFVDVEKDDRDQVTCSQVRLFAKRVS